jgi:hypothetical protein
MLRKIVTFAAIAIVGMLGTSLVASAQTQCDLVSNAEASTPSFYPSGFFSPGNPVNPLALMPEKDLACAATVRGLEAKTMRDVNTAEFSARAEGLHASNGLKVAEADQWRGQRRSEPGKPPAGSCRVQASRTGAQARIMRADARLGVAFTRPSRAFPGGSSR